MKILEASGKTLDEAIQNGLSQMGLDRDNADITVLDEATKGFLGIGAKPARVLITEKLRRVSREEDKKREAKEKAERDQQRERERIEKMEADRVRREQEKAEKARIAALEKEQREKDRAERMAREKGQKAQTATQPAAQAPVVKKEKAPAARPEMKKHDSPKYAEHRQQRHQNGQNHPGNTAIDKEISTAAKAAEPGKETDLSKEAMAYLADLLKHMGANVDLTAMENSNGIYITASGADAGTLIGYRGETLDALQYLVSLKINKGEDDYHRVSLDTEGYRAKREDILIKLAHRLANKAVKTGRKVSLEPMNPYERRILHSALQGHQGVRTHSEGADPYRRVVITPKAMQRRQSNGGQSRNGGNNGQPKSQDRAEHQQPAEIAQNESI